MRTRKRARRRHTGHGPRRLWYAPRTVICRCGLRAWPCYVVLMREHQRGMQPRPAGNDWPVEVENDWPDRSGVAVRLPRTAVPAARSLLTLDQAYRSRGRTW